MEIDESATDTLFHALSNGGDLITPSTLKLAFGKDDNINNDQIVKQLLELFDCAEEQEVDYRQFCKCLETKDELHDLCLLIGNDSNQESRCTTPDSSASPSTRSSDSGNDSYLNSTMEMRARANSLTGSSNLSPQRSAYFLTSDLRNSLSNQSLVSMADSNSELIDRLQELEESLLQSDYERQRLETAFDAQSQALDEELQRSSQLLLRLKSKERELRDARSELQRVQLAHQTPSESGSDSDNDSFSDRKRRSLPSSPLRNKLYKALQQAESEKRERFKLEKQIEQERTLSNDRLRVLSQERDVLQKEIAVTNDQLATCMSTTQSLQQSLLSERRKVIELTREIQDIQDQSRFRPMMNSPRPMSSTPLRTKAKIFRVEKSTDTVDLRDSRSIPVQTELSSRVSVAVATDICQRNSRSIPTQTESSSRKSVSVATNMTTDICQRNSRSVLCQTDTLPESQQKVSVSVAADRPSTSSLSRSVLCQTDKASEPPSALDMSDRKRNLQAQADCQEPDLMSSRNQSINSCMVNPKPFSRRGNLQPSRLGQSVQTIESKVTTTHLNKTAQHQYLLTLLPTSKPPSLGSLDDSWSLSAFTSIVIQSFSESPKTYFAAFALVLAVCSR